MSEHKGDEETSDEEEVAEPIQTLRRLRGKQPAPQYGPPPPAADNPEPKPSGTVPSSSAVPVIKRPAMLKRPTARKAWANKRCRGFDGVAFQFCPNEPGEPARVQAHQGHRHCIFCNKEKMQERRGKGRRCMVTPALKKFLFGNRSVFEAALQRVETFLGEEMAQWFARHAGWKEPPEKSWQELLQGRQQSTRPMKPKEVEEYQNLVRRDQRVARQPPGAYSWTKGIPHHGPGTVFRSPPGSPEKEAARSGRAQEEDGLGEGGLAGGDTAQAASCSFPKSC